MNYRVTGKTAFLTVNQSSKNIVDVTLTDDMVFRMVDDGVEEVGLLFKNTRYFATLDDWLDRKTDNGLRHMPLTAMDRR